MNLSTCFTERGPEAIQLHASDLPENIRSLSKISAANFLSRLGATKSSRGPQNSQQNKCYFFALGKREASEEHQTRAAGEGAEKKRDFPRAPSVTRVSSLARLLARFTLAFACLKSAKKSRLFCRQAAKRQVKPVDPCQC